MRLPFLTCDVFTDTRFGGNPLAVLPDATGLSAAQMQQVAREFNYSESTFVLPAEHGHDRRVRIFTPTREVPFAGHPNIGTAFALAVSGALGAITAPRTVTFEETAGVVAVQIVPRRVQRGGLGGGPGGVPCGVHDSVQDGGRGGVPCGEHGGVLSGERGDDLRFWCELTAPEPFTRGSDLPVGLVAAALGLAESDIVVRTHAPVVASVGLPFTIVEVVDLDALGRAQADPAALARLAATGAPPDVHLYTRARTRGSGSGDADGPDTGRPKADLPSIDGPRAEPPNVEPPDVEPPIVDLRARMFAPFDGVPEDPATGSANCALAALLAAADPATDASFRWRIVQGVEMGRPSLLEARATKRGAEVVEVRIGGESVLVSQGTIEV